MVKNKMADGQRKPVKRIVLHHSVGPEFVDSGDQTVADWFNTIGRGRGYKGVAHSYHIDPRTKKETFAQAHYALHKYTKDGNKYGWRMVLMIDDPMNNVAWHAGNWPVNQESIGIEVCGNFLDKELPLTACMLIADTFRPLDQKLKGALQVNLHKQFMATACPARIAERRDTIVDMINNPAKWNDKLFAPTMPTTPTTPTTPPATTPEIPVTPTVPEVPVVNPPEQEVPAEDDWKSKYEHLMVDIIPPLKADAEKWRALESTGYDLFEHAKNGQWKELFADIVQRLSSRKFLLTVAVGALIIMRGMNILTLSDDLIAQLVTVAGMFIGVEGASDLVKTFQKKE